MDSSGGEESGRSASVASKARYNPGEWSYGRTNRGQSRRTKRGEARLCPIMSRCSTAGTRFRQDVRVASRHASPRCTSASTSPVTRERGLFRSVSPFLLPGDFGGDLSASLGLRDPGRQLPRTAGSRNVRFSNAEDRVTLSRRSRSLDLLATTWMCPVISGKGSPPWCNHRDRHGVSNNSSWAHLPRSVDSHTPNEAGRSRDGSFQDVRRSGVQIVRPHTSVPPGVMAPEH